MFKLEFWMRIFAFGDLADLCGGGTRSNVWPELPNLPTELRIGRLQDGM